MNSDDRKIDERLVELEELYKLAEASTGALDRLELDSDRLRFRSLLSLLVGYVCIALGVGAIVFLNKEMSGIGGMGLYAVASFFLIISGVFLTYMAFEFVRRRRALNKEKLIEADIHQRLVVLIDDQMNRVSLSGRLSPVARATYEIRARRMWRGSRVPRQEH